MQWLVKGSGAQWVQRGGSWLGCRIHTQSWDLLPVLHPQVSSVDLKGPCASSPAAAGGRRDDIHCL